mmetsp:Transcript_57004/g.121035  ORF Transcript_57004/g.121035 Transcript_57004/m.121035 type:complete len:339 (+) Transcript_57004:130-1146(+)
MRAVLATATFLALNLATRTQAFAPSSHIVRQPRTFLSTSRNTIEATATKRSMSNEIELPPGETLDSLLDVAVRASKHAGEIILGNAGGADVLKSKANSRDLLTLIDPLCEKTIRETVLETFPSHDFLGEEDVPPGKEASAAAIDAKLANNPSHYLWIVDPIDGTSNFVHGMPLCMPSVAVAHKGEVVVGVIHDPHRQETFSAVKGRGAYMNGERIRVGEQSTIGDAIVAMGSPPAEESMKMSLAALPVLMPRVRTIRMIGSAALMLAWVANGRLTAYWEYDLSSWDVAAGSILIEEAGGSITDLENERWNLRTRKICASNGGRVHEKILEALGEAGVV